MEHAEHTGRWRHRVWKGRMVLQIEERGTYTESIGGYIDTRDVTRWRDARPEDLTVAAQPAPMAA